MIFDYIFLGGLIFLGLASITDIKRKEVPDKISMVFILYGLILNIFFGILYGFTNKELLNWGILFVVTLIGILMYKTRQWGGADVKIMLGIGLLFILNSGYFYILFLINFLIVGAIYGLLGSVYTVFDHFSLFKKEFSAFSKTRKYLLFFNSLVVVVFAFFNIFLSVLSFLLVLLYLLNVFKKTFMEAMTHDRKIELLVDGDWLKQSIKHKGKILIDYDTKQMLSQKDIDFLKKKGVKSVKIIEGFAFVPAILISYCLTLFFEDAGLKLFEIFLRVLIV